MTLSAEATVSHPNVLEATAYAALPPGSSEEELIPAEIAEHCSQLPPKFAIPRFIEAFAEFPRTRIDRVRKLKLCELGVGATTWDSNARW